RGPQAERGSWHRSAGADASKHRPQWRSNQPSGPETPGSLGLYGLRSLLPPLQSGAQGVSEFQPGLVQLRFAVADRAVEHSCDLIMLVALYVVQDKDQPIASRKIGDCALERKSIDRSGQRQIRGTEATTWTVIVGGFHCFVQGHKWQSLLAQVHEHNIDREAVQPCGKSRVSSKCCDLSMQLKERLLRQIFSFSCIAHHAQAEGVNAPFVDGIELGKGEVVSSLSTCKCIGVWGVGRGRRRIGRRGAIRSWCGSRFVVG